MRMAMFPNSLRWRLQLWIGFLLLCLLAGFGVTAYHLHSTNQLTQIDQELKRRVELLSSALRNRVGGEPRFMPPPPGGPGRRFPGGEMLDRRPAPRGPGPGLGNGPGLRGPGDPDGPGHPGEPIPVPNGSGRGFGLPKGFDRFAPTRDISLPVSVLSLFEPGPTGTNAFYFVVWSRDAVILLNSTNPPTDSPLPESAAGDGATRMRSRDAFREAFYFNGLGECVLVGKDISSDLGALRSFSLLLLAAGCAVLVLGLGGGWWLTAQAIRPVEQISAAASRISAGNLSERISVKETESELSRLAVVLNETFARLEDAFAQQKQFTADASHELRTPIAVLISEAQTALARPRSSAEYRETIEVTLAAAQQMRQLTESLLALARLDTGNEPLQCASFDLAEETRVCVDLVRSLALERRLTLKTELAPAPCHGDARRIGQVITNLLTNAIHYSLADGEVCVSTVVQNGSAILIVADNGIGIDPADLPHVFERFYRADRARSRSEGRSGLGLAISKAIVDAHGGTIEVRSQPGKGSIFTLRLPAAPRLTAEQA